MKKRKSRMKLTKQMARAAGELYGKVSGDLDFAGDAATQTVQAFQIVRMMIAEIRAGRPIADLDAIDDAAATAIAAITEQQQRRGARKVEA